MQKLFDNQNETTCAAWTQKYRQLARIVRQMHERQGQFLENLDTSALQDVSVLNAGFENDSLEYTDGFKIEAFMLVYSHLRDTSPGARNPNRLDWDAARGRIDVIGSIHREMFKTAYIPALIRKVTKDVFLRSEVVSLDHIEEIGGYLNSHNPILFTAARLRKIGQIGISAEETVLPVIEEINDGTFLARKLELPSLRSVRVLTCGNATEKLDLSSLEIAGELDILNTKSVSLPSLLRVRNLLLRDSYFIDVPRLEKITGRLSIQKLNPRRTFREAFPELTYIGDTVTVGNVERKRELEALGTDPNTPLQIDEQVVVERM